MQKNTSNIPHMPHDISDGLLPKFLLFLLPDPRKLSLLLLLQPPRLSRQACIHMCVQHILVASYVRQTHWAHDLPASTPRAASDMAEPVLVLPRHLPQFRVPLLAVAFDDLDDFVRLHGG